MSFELKESKPIGATLSRKIIRQLILNKLELIWEVVLVTCTLPTFARPSIAASILLAEASYGIADVANPMKDNEKVPDNDVLEEFTHTT